MSSFTQVLGSLIVVITIAGASQFNSLSVLAQQPDQCDMNTPCRWAVCGWRPTLTPNRQLCRFVDNCQCPEGTSCELTSNIKPGPSNVVTFDYQCASTRTGR
ncbi:uncharacterized protein LOC125376260 [Haliotis rufescens]|uniref:uncharacterized protein LOC125376260 n=1 Tax=Haliotis rufescens TaxID=6454 RepID=UPI00201F37EF|nr:uncharacterized protein LOC125376260 [Haliotis rufescens]